MKLAWYDNAAPHKTYALPRKPFESRTDYTLRFFKEIRGLGNCTICTVKGFNRKSRSRRSM